MVILVLNCGSSSIKYQVIDMEAQSSKLLAKGLVERIGLPEGDLTHKPVGKEKFELHQPIPDHTTGISLVLQALTDPVHGVIRSLDEVKAVGHRVAHGGEFFPESCLVTEQVQEKIRSLFQIAPLHNPANLEGILSIEKVLPGVKQVAVFDTSFHQTLPATNFMYALPYEYYQKYGIRKYGFHGTSHHYVTLATAKFLNQKVEDTTIITCHLGNGCSMAAVKNGKVIDTTMGLTPLEGLMMGTRCGDLDPAAVIRLVDLGHTTAEVDKILNKQSGLYGVGDINSGDMRDMLAAAEKGSERAELALKMFARRIVKYIGAYYVLLDGPQAISFTGGVGEFSVPMRKRIMDQLGSLGLKLDDGRNAECFGKAGVISTDDSSWKAIVMPTDEELMIARSVVDTLHLK